MQLIAQRQEIETKINLLFNISKKVFGLAFPNTQTLTSLDQYKDLIYQKSLQKTLLQVLVFGESKQKDPDLTAQIVLIQFKETCLQKVFSLFRMQTIENFTQVSKPSQWADIFNQKNIYSSCVVDKISIVNSIDATVGMTGRLLTMEIPSAETKYTTKPYFPEFGLSLYTDNKGRRTRDFMVHVDYPLTAEPVLEVKVNDSDIILKKLFIDLETPSKYASMISNLFAFSLVPTVVDDLANNIMFTVMQGRYCLAKTGSSPILRLEKCKKNDKNMLFNWNQETKHIETTDNPKLCLEHGLGSEVNKSLILGSCNPNTAAIFTPIAF